MLGPFDRTLQKEIVTLIRMPRIVIPVFAGLLVVFAAACSSSSSTSGAATPGAPTPGAGTPGAAASIGLSSVAPGVSQPVVPSFAGDPELASKFPKTVSGNPVTGVTTARIIDFYNALGTADADVVKTRQALAAVGINLDTVIFGSATATIAGSPVSFQAIRVPGQDANKLVDAYKLITPLEEGETLSKETVGGKSATVVRSADGYASTWLYAKGDIVWSLDTSSAEEAAAVFAALP